MASHVHHIFIQLYCLDSKKKYPWLLQIIIRIICRLGTCTGSELRNWLDLPALYHKCLTLFEMTSLGDYRVLSIYKLRWNSWCESVEIPDSHVLVVYIGDQLIAARQISYTWQADCCQTNKVTFWHHNLYRKMTFLKTSLLVRINWND